MLWTSWTIMQVIFIYFLIASRIFFLSLVLLFIIWYLHWIFASLNFTISGKLNLKGCEEKGHGNDLRCGARFGWFKAPQTLSGSWFFHDLNHAGTPTPSLCIYIDNSLRIGHGRALTHVIGINVCMVPLQAVIQDSDHNSFACNAFLPNRYHMEIQLGQGCSHPSVLLVKTKTKKHWYSHDLLATEW